MKNEIFKDIEEYNGLYQVSSLGRVYSVRSDKFLKFDTSKRNKTSYHRVTLSKNGKTSRYQVHRLVAKHFIDNPQKKPYVNHIDNNGLNNHYLNLEWCTHSENMIHAQKQGRLFETQSKAGKIAGRKSAIMKSKKYLNLVGKTFGYWKVLELTNLNGKPKGICLCTNCNNTKSEIQLSPIVNGQYKWCKSCALKQSYKDRGIITKDRTPKFKKNKAVDQILNTKIINSFSTISEAEIHLGVKPGSSKIGQVCKGKAKSYHGFQWKFSQAEDIV